MAEAALRVQGLNVFYGQSHALQGVDLTLGRGVLSVVGRNGMGKTTLCKTITGLVRAHSGGISLHGESLLGRSPAEIARLGVGYVPQGRRLWPSLTVDEHLKLVAKRGGAWTVERVYSTFPRLAERRGNGGGQLSGGEQQMLAISRALLLNPRLLVMDEPTEGLAPVIVDQVAEMLIRLGHEGAMDILVIEQNIGVACAVSDQVAIMVNGRINRVMESARLAADRDLQQSLLGVGRHAHEETPSDEDEAVPEIRDPGLTRIYLSNPQVPTRWSAPAPVRVIEGAARTVTEATGPGATVRPLAALSALKPGAVIVAGTYDTKAAELGFIAERLKAAGLRVRPVDLSTSGKPSGVETPPHTIAAHHPRGSSGVFTGERGAAVTAIALAFERWIARQEGVSGAIGAGGSGAASLVAPGFRQLPVGVPKIIVSSVASGQTKPYVGGSDIMMMHSVADIQGLNSITRDVLGNAAEALDILEASIKAAITRTAI